MKKSKINFFTGEAARQSNANASYETFMQGRPAKLLPEVITAEKSHHHSLLEKSAVSLTKEGAEHKFHHKFPRTTVVIGTVVEALEIKSNYESREIRSLQKGKNPSEASVCAAVGAAVATSTKIVGYSAVGVASRGLSFMQTAGVYTVTSPLIEKTTEKLGDLGQRACHSTYSLGRSIQEEKKTMPSMRKY